MPTAVLTTVESSSSTTKSSADAGLFRNSRSLCMSDLQKKPSEIPTQETLAKGAFKEEPLSATAGAKKRLRRVDGTEIDRLYMGGHLTQDEHTTLDAFRKDLYEAGLVFCPRAGITPASTSGGAQFIADSAFRRVLRVGKQMEALASKLSSVERGSVLSALTMDERIKRGQEQLMKSAAEVLAPLYRR